MNSAYVHAGRLLEALGDPLAAHGRALLDRICKPWAAREHLAPSVLTPDGSPLELAFTTASREVRLTTEPSLPDDPPATKCDAARELFAARSDDPLLAEMRSAPDQRFGCWIGARCGAAGQSMKLYQEVAPSMRAVVMARMRDAWPGIADVRPMLIGVTEEAVMEFYAAVPAPRPRTLHALFAAAGLPQLSTAAVRTLEIITAREPRRLFDEVCIGVSLRPGAITLFAPAGQLFGGDDGVARQRLLAAARRLGRDFDTYEAATRALDRRTVGPLVHGMAGIAASAAGLHCWAGIRPFG